jgi:hypothetical protein
VISRKPYGSLRFIAWLIEYIGFVIIILSWVGVAYWFISLQGVYRSVDVDAASRSLMTALNSTVTCIVLGAGLVGNFVGILVIAYGQVIKVFLDIRDDVHVGLKDVRRIAFIAKENPDA